MAQLALFTAAERRLTNLSGPHVDRGGERLAHEVRVGAVHPVGLDVLHGAAFCRGVGVCAALDLLASG